MRHGFNTWFGKLPWRRKCLPTPVFLSGKFHGQRSLVAYNPWGHKESDTTVAKQNFVKNITVLKSVILCCENNHITLWTSVSRRTHVLVSYYSSNKFSSLKEYLFISSQLHTSVGMTWQSSLLRVSSNWNQDAGMPHSPELKVLPQAHSCYSHNSVLCSYGSEVPQFLAGFQPGPAFSSWHRNDILSLSHALNLSAVLFCHQSEKVLCF